MKTTTEIINETTLTEDIFYVLTFTVVIAIVTTLFAYTIWAWNKDK